MAEERIRTDVANTSAGKVSGYKKGMINVFKGIPYSHVGLHNRFRLAAAQAWNGVRDALAIGSRCPRQGGAEGGLLGGGRVEESAEDCLVLNVWTPALRDGGKLGAPHALDVPLVFDNAEKSKALLGEGPQPQLVADQMSAAWIAFAHTGNPRWHGGPEWPAYTEAKRETMVFDVRSRVEADRHADMRAALYSIPPLRMAK